MPPPFDKVKEAINNPSESIKRDLDLMANQSNGIGDSMGQTVSTIQTEVSENRKSFFFRSWIQKETREAHMQLIQASGQKKVINENPEYRFMISNAKFPQREKYQIMRTFGSDPDFLSMFGEDVKVWTFSGFLRNEKRIKEPLGPGDGDWVNAIQSRYEAEFRASKLARRRQMLRLVMADLVIEGYMLNLNVSRNARNGDKRAAFSFKMLVRNKYATSKRALPNDPPGQTVDSGESNTEESDQAA